MFILLVGPKGSGKSHIGRVLSARLEVHHVDVEPIWMAYYEECRAAARAAVLADGLERVGPVISAALEEHRHVAVDTTGAAPEILDYLLGLWPRERTLFVFVTAPLPVCLARIAARDLATHIPVDRDVIETMYGLSMAVASGADLTLENTDPLPEERIVDLIASHLTRERS